MLRSAWSLSRRWEYSSQHHIRCLTTTSYSSSRGPSDDFGPSQVHIQSHIKMKARQYVFIYYMLPLTLWLLFISLVVFLTFLCCLLLPLLFGFQIPSFSVLESILFLSLSSDVIISHLGVALPTFCFATLWFLSMQQLG